MSDWENESEDEKGNDEIQTGYEDESEVIIHKAKPEKKENKVEKEKEKTDEKIDYEKKYNELHKELIETNKEIDKAVAGIKDEDLKLKKRLELTRMKQAEKFMGQTKQEELVLNLEKDFVELAKRITVKINDTNLPSKFTYTYLKNIINLSSQDLDSEKINDISKALSIIYNKKLKEEGGPSSNKKKLGNTNLYQRKERIGIATDLGGKEEKEEEYGDDDFM